MKRLIAYICLTIFSFQILPVKEIGEILFKNQITEEEVHGCCESNDCGMLLKLKKEGDPFDHSVYLSQNSYRVIHLSHEMHTAIYLAEHLPPHFVPDIVTPPPNRLG